MSWETENDKLKKLLGEKDLEIAILRDLVKKANPTYQIKHKYLTSGYSWDTQPKWCYVLSALKQPATIGKTKPLKNLVFFMESGLYLVILCQRTDNFSVTNKSKNGYPN